MDEQQNEYEPMSKGMYERLVQHAPDEIGRRKVHSEALLTSRKVKFHMDGCEVFGAVASIENDRASIQTSYGKFVRHVDTVSPEW
jgi:hypothetical protein